MKLILVFAGILFLTGCFLFQNAGRAYIPACRPADLTETKIINKLYDSPAEERIAIEKGIITSVTVNGRASGTASIIMSPQRGIYEKTMQPQTNPTTASSTGDIATTLSYASNQWDPNNDGLTSSQGVIDLQITATHTLDEANFCTLWDIGATEEGATYQQCNGNRRCCTYLELAPSSDNWDEPLFVTYGKFGISTLNTVSATIVSITPDFEVTRSAPVSLPANFDAYDIFSTCGNACRMEEKTDLIQLNINTDEGAVFIDNVTYHYKALC
jgi:hypothetical protein